MQSKDLLELLFQGKEPKSYLKAASKLLIAGFLGVVVGWVAQPFFSVVLGVPYWLAYWPAVLAGFLVNLRSQVKMNNLKVKDNETA